MQTGIEDSGLDSILELSVMLLFLGLILFISLVVVHELGHFIAARRNGVEVEEFGIGFPPRAWKKRLKNDVLFTINWLPLGGFVRLKGEHDSDKTPGSYGNAKLWPKAKIMVAGIFMNLLAAFVILTAVAWLGIPKLIDNQFTVANDTKVIKNDVLIAYVEPNSPAETAGLKIKDNITSFESEHGDLYKIEGAEKLPDITKKLAGQTITINFNRDNKAQSSTASLRSQSDVELSKDSDNPKGYLGISPTEYTLQRSTWSAPVVALGLIKQFTVLTFQGLGNALADLFNGRTSEAGSQVAGPVGIVVLLKDGSLLGYQFILVIIAIISLTLAIMNALPIPALDGGRLFVTLLYRAMRRPLTQKTEQLIHGSGFAFLMLLFVVITIVDIKRYF